MLHVDECMIFQFLSFFEMQRVDFSIWIFLEGFLNLDSDLHLDFHVDLKLHLDLGLELHLDLHYLCWIDLAKSYSGNKQKLLA